MPHAAIGSHTVVNNVHAYLTSKKFLAPAFFCGFLILLLTVFISWIASSTGAVPHGDLAIQQTYGDTFRQVCNHDSLYWHHITNQPDRVQMPQSLEERKNTADKKFISVHGMLVALPCVAVSIPVSVFLSRLLTPSSALEANVLTMRGIGGLGQLERGAEIQLIGADVFRNGLNQWKFLMISIQIVGTAADAAIVYGSTILLDFATGIDSYTLTINAVLGFWKDRFGPPKSHELAKAINDSVPWQNLVCEVQIKGPISNIHEFTLPITSDSHLILSYCVIAYRLAGYIIYAVCIVWIVSRIVRFLFWPYIALFHYGAEIVKAPVLITFEMWSVCDSSRNAQDGMNLYETLVKEEGKELEKRAQNTTGEGAHELVAMPAAVVEVIDETSASDANVAAGDCSASQTEQHQPDNASLNTVSTDCISVDCAIEITETVAKAEIVSLPTKEMKEGKIQEGVVLGLGQLPSEDEPRAIDQETPPRQEDEQDASYYYRPPDHAVFVGDASVDDPTIPRGRFSVVLRFARKSLARAATGLLRAVRAAIAGARGAILRVCGK